MTSLEAEESDTSIGEVANYEGTFEDAVSDIAIPAPELMPFNEWVGVLEEKGRIAPNQTPWMRSGDDLGRRSGVMASRDAAFSWRGLEDGHGNEPDFSQRGRWASRKSSTITDVEACGFCA